MQIVSPGQALLLEGHQFLSRDLSIVAVADLLLICSFSILLQGCVFLEKLLP